MNNKSTNIFLKTHDTNQFDTTIKTSKINNDAILIDLIKNQRKLIKNYYIMILRELVNIYLQLFSRTNAHCGLAMLLLLKMKTKVHTLISILMAENMHYIDCYI